MDTPVNPEGNNDQTEPAMEQDEPGHVEHSSEQTSEDNDPEGGVHQTGPGQEDSRTMTHSSFQKNAWNERTSTESLWPQRKV